VVGKEIAVKKYVVRLSAEEHAQLDELIRKGKRSAQLVTKARILLKTDVSELGEGWSDSRIAAALDTSIATIERTRRQLVEEGFEAVLRRKYNPNSARPRIFDGVAEAKLIALTLSPAPEGFARWSLRLLEEKVVELSATRILWGQLLFVLIVVLGFLWAATEWTAWRLAYQPQLGPACFMIGRWPIYQPLAFFIWWFKFDAYAPVIFMQGACIAASGGIAAVVIAIVLSVWRAREARHVTTYGSARWADAREIRRAGLLGPDGVVLGRFDGRSRYQGREFPVDLGFSRALWDRTAV
jgi:hypothetical protein